MLTDRFVGYLMRHHVRSFFAAGDPNLGFQFTLRLMQDRRRRAALGEAYDPRVADYIEDFTRATLGHETAASDSRPGVTSMTAATRAESREHA